MVIFLHWVLRLYFFLELQIFFFLLVYLLIEVLLLYNAELVSVLYSGVNQLYVNTYPLSLGPPSQLLPPTHP